MKKHRLVKQFLIAGFGLAFWTGSLSAAAPLAGTAIGNQAKATYTDSSAQTREVFSNSVVTTVTQVPGFTLVTDGQSKNATPGSQVFFSHTLTNTGNGIDSFDLSIDQAGAFSFGTFRIYVDSNRDGLPDNFNNIITTGDVAPGAEFHFVVSGVVPGSAAPGDVATITVSATSVLSLNPSFAEIILTNTDTVTVVSGAVMQVTKAISEASGFPGNYDNPAPKEYTYTITYTNTGNATAQDFTIRDNLPDFMTYVENSGRWSITGTGVPLNDDTAETIEGTAPNTIDYRYDEGNGEITVVLANVTAGQSGFITFKVTIDNDTAPQTLLNTAFHKIGAGGTEFPTNTVPFQVLQVAAVNLDGDTVAEADAGSTVVFRNELTNNGTGIDTFDITFSNGDAGSLNGFPAGTTFQLFQEDEQTPMVDSNGNGIPDTGPIAVGGTYTVVIKAYLPADIGDGSGPFHVTKTATSTFNSGVSDNAVDTLTTVNGASVDITDTAAYGQPNVQGQGLGENGSTKSANPGEIVDFVLFINNRGPKPDTYDIMRGALEPGWSVSFVNSNGTVVSNTGVVQNNQAGEITARVNVPAGQLPGDYPIVFTAISPSSGALDYITVTVKVNTVRKIELATSSAAQTFPGGSVVYEHILTNVGNLKEGDGVNSIFTLALTDTLVNQAWSSVAYWDVDGDGVLDDADPVVVGALHGNPAFDGMEPGERIRLFVKVFAPLGAADGATNITKINVNVSGNIVDGVNVPASVWNEDVTTVVRGDLLVVKWQAVQTGGPPAWTRNAVLEAPPGATIMYRIEVTNIGSDDATNIVLYDRVPAHTNYVSNSAMIGVDPIDPDPAGRDLEFNLGTLKPAETATAYFSVRIND